MSENKALDAYLNDHMAGSAAAVELVERIRENDPAHPSPHLEVLGQAIEADRDTLTTVMERLSVAPSEPKQAAGKVLETEPVPSTRAGHGQL